MFFVTCRCYRVGLYSAHHSLRCVAWLPVRGVLGALEVPGVLGASGASTCWRWTGAACTSCTRPRTRPTRIGLTRTSSPPGRYDHQEHYFFCYRTTSSRYIWWQIITLKYTVVIYNYEILYLTKIYLKKKSSIVSHFREKMARKSYSQKG